MLFNFFNFVWASRVDNTVVLNWTRDLTRRVMAYNLKTQQITFDELYSDSEEDDYGCNYNLNETAKEIHIGRTKLRITSDNVIEEEQTAVNYLPEIMAIQSDLCITQSEEETKLWKCDGDDYEEINVLILHPEWGGWKYRDFYICPDTSRIVNVFHRQPQDIVAVEL